MLEQEGIGSRSLCQWSVQTHYNLITNSLQTHYKLTTKSDFIYFLLSWIPGFAACCSFKFTCGQETQMNETLFVNRQYPNHENDTNTCQVTIKKLDNVCQLRLGFQIIKKSLQILFYANFSFIANESLLIETTFYRFIFFKYSSSILFINRKTETKLKLLFKSIRVF